MDASPLHAILGANGVIGRELSHALASAGQRMRQVSRSPEGVTADDELVAADLRDPAATRRAVAGSEVAYLVAGLKYDTNVWREQWPRLMRNVIDACKEHSARLVFFDNVYAYGRVDGAMTEETPFNPVSRKGEVRARIATMLLDEMRAGNIDALIARSADFHGPGAVLSLPYITVFERLNAGKTPQWIGNVKAVHAFTYTPDAAKAVAVLGRSPAAFGQTWHVPTSPEEMTGEHYVRVACELAGRPYRLQRVPEWVLRLMGMFQQDLRENMEMMYQFNNDYRFRSAKIERAYGLTPTSYRAGIAATLRSMRTPSPSGSAD